MKTSLRLIKQSGENISALFMLLLLITVSLQIVTRALNDPLIWTEELSRIIFVAMIFIGAIPVEHIRVEAFLNLLDDSWRKRINTVNYIVEAIFILSIVYIFCKHNSLSKSVSTVITEINLWFLYFVIPLSFVLILIKDFIISKLDKNYNLLF